MYERHYHRCRVRSRRDEEALQRAGRKSVIAWLYDPEHERACEQLGLDYVCEASLVAEEVFAKITAGHDAHTAAAALAALKQL